jgi:hypothetical protein
LLIVPVGSSWRPRSALACASTSAACASATAALDCASSAVIVSLDRRASSWPLLTTLPTSTRTSVSRSPCSSAPITASCHAVTLPFAESVRGHSICSGGLVVTVSAGRAGAAAAAGAAGAAAFLSEELANAQKAPAPSIAIAARSARRRVLLPLPSRAHSFAPSREKGLGGMGWPVG